MVIVPLQLYIPQRGIGRESLGGRASKRGGSGVWNSSFHPILHPHASQEVHFRLKREIHRERLSGDILPLLLLCSALDIYCNSPQFMLSSKVQGSQQADYFVVQKINNSFSLCSPSLYRHKRGSFASSLL